MPEDAGKKRYIRNFLNIIKRGEGYVEDIWIERDVRLPGQDGQGYIKAQSISRKSSISNITELLQDDLEHTFDDRYFTFRFVAALLGSGKTSLLNYLHKLIQTQANYEKHSVVVKFPLYSLQTVSSNHNFSVKFYHYVLGYTFWTLINNQKLLPSVKEVAKNILAEYGAESLLNTGIKKEIQKNAFLSKFNKLFNQIEVNLVELFFDVISQVTRVDPSFTFVYLIDELDSLEKFPQDIEETRVIFRALLKHTVQKFGGNIPLLIYLVGTSDNARSLIEQDSVLNSLVKESIINLNSGAKKEFTMIKQEIDERLKGAYTGYKNFNNAWQEIQNIPLKFDKNFREFCQYYSGKVLEIHEKYFSEAEEQKFEGDARELVKAECQKRWEKYLIKEAYTLSAVETTKVLQGKKTRQKHALDCYVELLHNDRITARAFGEAKNYKLIIGHLDDFSSWLDDLEFNPYPSEDVPPDLAFIIAPSCSELLKRKLDLKNIEFIQADKVIDKVSTKLLNLISSTINKVIETKPTSSLDSKVSTTININTASEAELEIAFKGLRIRADKRKKLINNRKNDPYRNLADLVFDLKFGNSIEAKLQQKLDKGEICF